MKISGNFLLAILGAVLALAVLHQPVVQAHAGAPARTANKSKAAAERLQKKLDWLRQNGEQARPDPRPTVMTQDEIDAYFASGRVALPKGVENVRFELAPGHGGANMQVDFDQLTGQSSNLLLALFSGVHQVAVQAHGEASGGVAQTHIDSVWLDGEEVPRFLLQLFVERLLKPKYPQASLDPTFRLPEKIDRAQLGERQVTVTQK